MESRTDEGDLTPAPDVLRWRALELRMERMMRLAVAAFLFSAVAVALTIVVWIVAL